MLEPPVLADQTPPSQWFCIGSSSCTCALCLGVGLDHWQPGRVDLLLQQGVLCSLAGDAAAFCRQMLPYGAFPLIWFSICVRAPGEGQGFLGMPL